MRYLSTRGASPPVSLREALLAGIAPGGGLHMPESIPPLDFAALAAAAAPAARAALLLAPYLEPEIGRADRERLMAAALDFPIPLRPLDETTSLLELFHGPTLAFKDVGARVLARLLSHFNEGDRPLTVLVATSGDTGGAVASAFFGLPRVRVVVLYPRGQVSRLQEAQFASLGGNVTALAVEGTFDDCQRLAKEAFADASLRRQARLTSANSISIGRLLPQIAYYVEAAVQAAGGAPGGVASGSGARPIVFAVPSGNFGNLTAGLIAKRMGLPVARFVAATNANDVVPEWLRTGRYAPRPSVRTLSTAMDVGAPSNRERIVALYGGDLDAIRADVTASAHTDDETRACIREVRARHGVPIDPHTAVGLLGLRAARASGDLPPDAHGIILATAHPAKFRDTMEPIVGESIPVPPALAALERRPTGGVIVEPALEAIRGFLVGPASGLP